MKSQGADEKYYIEYLKKTDSFPRSFYHKAKHDMARKMLDCAPLGSFVLDAGCGIGNITAQYCDRYSIIGIDEQLAAVLHCRKFHSGKYIQADLYNIPFADNTFDIILFLDAIEHIQHPALALKELARVLKPKAKIVICTINYANPLWFMLENTWHRFFGGNCKTYSKDVHPCRFNASSMRRCCSNFFKERCLQKRVMNMEIFYVGEK